MRLGQALFKAAVMKLLCNGAKEKTWALLLHYVFQLNTQRAASPPSVGTISALGGALGGLSYTVEEALLRVQIPLRRRVTYHIPY